MDGQPASYAKKNTAHENKDKFLKYTTLHRNKGHLDFDEGKWEVQMRASDSSASEHSFISSAAFNDSFHNRAPLFKTTGSQAYEHMDGILRTKEVSRMFNIGDGFGSGKYGIIKLVEKKNYSKIRFAMKTIPLEPGYEDYV